MLSSTRSVLSFRWSSWSTLAILGYVTTSSTLCYFVIQFTLQNAIFNAICFSIILFVFAIASTVLSCTFKWKQHENLLKRREPCVAELKTSGKQDSLRIDEDLPCAQYINIDNWLHHSPVEYAQIAWNAEDYNETDVVGMRIVQTPPKGLYFENRMYTSILILDQQGTSRINPRFLFSMYPSEPTIGSSASLGHVSLSAYANVPSKLPVRQHHQFRKSSSCSDLTVQRPGIESVLAESTFMGTEASLKSIGSDNVFLDSEELDYSEEMVIEL